ncbi:hypothetical protein DUI87_12573 [Hirundo rustica rustica]|uniref:Linker for activation of T-cells family member 2 n=1 Tax=Hirundo rustica rustica TaxID=333673 RepID=A0A3M0KEA0_HIRRU|nr:hypothetical protein DUI87_12573 [Hirundo rustica rustica]
MVQPELWAAAALMLLGAAVSLCIRCRPSATRRETRLNERRRQKAIEELSASHHTGYGSRDESRYQNFLAESCLQEDTAYVEPIALDYYYNCTRFFNPPHGRCPGRQEKDEDSYSYENVTIGASQGSDPDDAVDYENSLAIHTWKLQQGQAPLTESLDDEPDYINAGPVSGPALLSEQRTSSNCESQIHRYQPPKLYQSLSMALEPHPKTTVPIS